jgi:hypothetical protein
MALMGYAYNDSTTVDSRVQGSGLKSFAEQTIRVRQPQTCGFRPRAIRLTRKFHPNANNTFRVARRLVIFSNERAPCSARYPNLMVMVAVVAFPDGNDAAVGDLAFHMLELDGRVDHVEIVLQDLFHVAQNALAHRRGNIGNCNMTG